MLWHSHETGLRVEDCVLCKSMGINDECDFRVVTAERRREDQSNRDIEELRWIIDD